MRHTLFLILIVIILMVQVKEIFLVQLGVQLMLLVDIIHYIYYMKVLSDLIVFVMVILEEK